MKSLWLFVAWAIKTEAFVVPSNGCVDRGVSFARRRAASSPALCLSSISPPHPAVEGWPEKYNAASTSEDASQQPSGRGPRILHDVFTVEPANEDTLYQLDVQNWPTWTTAKNPKWRVGKQNADKIMPYGELSYVVSGKLEIIPFGSNEKIIVQPGDFVTFPENFKASWTVVDELTWHYYLY